MRDILNYIQKDFEERSVILELGSGVQSTKVLAQRFNLYSIEDNKKYLDRYGSTYIFAPLVNYKRVNGLVYRWYNCKILDSKLPSRYDLILVDGPINLKFRIGFADNLHLFLRNVPIIFHDFENPFVKKLIQEVKLSLDKRIKLLGRRSVVLI